MYRVPVTAFAGCFGVGRGGEKGQWRAYPGVSGRQHCNTIGNRKGGRWQWSATGREGGGGGGRAAALSGLRHSRDGKVGEQQWAHYGIVQMAFKRWCEQGSGGGGLRDVGVLRALCGVGILGGAG